jgi:hypothetical protein
MSIGETEPTPSSFLHALSRRDQIESYSGKSMLIEELILAGLAKADAAIAELADNPQIRGYYEKLGGEVVRATGIIIELEPFFLKLGLESEIVAKKEQIRGIVESPLWSGVRYYRDGRADGFSAGPGVPQALHEQQKAAPFIEGMTGDEATMPNDAADIQSEVYDGSRNSKTRAKEVPKTSLVNGRNGSTRSTGAKALRGNIPSGEQDSPPPHLSRNQEKENPHEVWVRALQQSVTDVLAELRNEGHLRGAKHHADSLSGRNIVHLPVNGETLDILTMCKKLQEEGLLLGRKNDPTVRDNVVMLLWDEFAGQFMNTDPRIRNAALGVVENQIKIDFEEIKRKDRLETLHGIRT